MSEAKRLTEAQHEVLAYLGKMDRRSCTNSISAGCGHRFSRWSYGKLTALLAAGLVRQHPSDRVSVTSWQINDAGRAALAASRFSQKETGNGEG